MSKDEWMYKDVDGFHLDVGDYVKFAESDRFGEIFRILSFSLKGTAYIQSGSKFYKVPGEKLRWVR